MPRRLSRRLGGGCRHVRFCALTSPERTESPPNGPALSCRPPVNVPSPNRRLPGESTPTRAAGGWRAGQASQRRPVSCSDLLGGGRGRRTLVARLVHAQRSASWESDLDEPTPSFVVDCGARDAPLSHLAHELLDISNHQVELVLYTRLGRMKRHLGWREAKD